MRKEARNNVRTYAGALHTCTGVRHLKTSLCPSLNFVPTYMLHFFSYANTYSDKCPSLPPTVESVTIISWIK